MLSFPDPNLPYTLYTDASSHCIGACLTQSVFEDGIVVERPIGHSWCGYGRSFIQMEDDNSYSKTIAFNRDIY